MYIYGPGFRAAPSPSPPMHIRPRLWVGVVGWEGAPPPPCGSLGGYSRNPPQKVEEKHASMHAYVHARMYACMHACMYA